MNPAMSTLSPASTRTRVEMLASCDPDEFVGVAVGVVFGVPAGEAVGDAVEPGDDVAPGVAVAVPPGVAVAVAVGVGLGRACGAVATNTFASSRLIQPTFADQTKPRS